MLQRLWAKEAFLSEYNHQDLPPPKVARVGGAVINLCAVCNIPACNSNTHLRAHPCPNRMNLRFAKKKNLHLLWMSRDGGMVALFEKQVWTLG